MAVDWRRTELHEARRARDLRSRTYSATWLPVETCPDCGSGTRREELLRPSGFLGTSKPHAAYETLAFVPPDRARVSAAGAPWVSLSDPATGALRTSREGKLLVTSSGPGGAGYAICISCGRAEAETGEDSEALPAGSLRAEARPSAGCRTLWWGAALLDESGRWRLDALEIALNSISGPKLIALAWANGETGVLQDLAAIKAVAEQYGAACLVDASQAVGRVAFEADSSAYLTFSGHKLHGPKGVGVFVQPEAAPTVEIAVGGGQERGWRGGTLNVPGITGLGVACELRKRDLNSAIIGMARLRDRFEKQVMSAIPDVRVNGADAQRVPNTSNLTVPGVEGMALVARLEARGILCSQVSACSSGQPEPSRTLLAMGLSRDDAYASLRKAVAVDTREEEIEIAAQALVEEALFLREMMGGLV